MAKGGSAPKADPNIGKAALMQAELGNDYLAYMQDQSAVTNGWATEDRAYAQDTYRPLERELVADAKDYASPARQDQRAAAAVASVGRQATAANEAEARSLAASGVKPGSGRSLASSQRGSLATALAKASADTTSRRAVEAEGYARKSDAVNMGKGYAVNPATSMGMTTQAMASGFQGAMGGQQGMAQTLQGVQDEKWNAYNARQQQSSNIMQGAGMLAGAFLSTKTVKTPKGPASKRSLKAVRDMDIDKWTYDKGKGDEGTHVGPYAEDFKKHTGLGDGKQINVIDAVGTSLGATKELASKVDKLAANVAKLTKGRSLPRPAARAAA
jgi:hypothetical protein